MKLRIPRPASKLHLQEWTEDVLTIGSVSDDEFIATLERLPRPTQRRLFLKIRKAIGTPPPLSKETKQYVTDDVVWKADIPALLTEWEQFTEHAPYRHVFTIMRSVLKKIASRAIEIDDPALNIIMLYAALYDGAHDENIGEVIASQRKRLQK